MIKKVKNQERDKNIHQNHRNNTFKYKLDIDTTLMDTHTVINEGKNKSY
ncbi:hypothetical protein [Tepidibacter hydrothermalis]|uniref:Uncharacterized protein n=1 Tax=Tepidibacter hydrothermalis TaxID=3036126 RepID=A0ABY8E7Q1_9FIRM|nr:hypothetical protein [Tepidibacter hydrothermalis]WFD08902.1 hypothetical protein P4S50_10925 [Tepidibacter hydrothermalis]